MTEKEPSLDYVLKMINCSVSKCNKNMEKVYKLQDESYIKLADLLNKVRLNKISNDEYHKETKKIVIEINKHKDNIEFIKCKIKNCNDNIRNVLIYTVNKVLKIKKDKKSKVMLNNYLYKFKQPIINYKDIINFYNDLEMIS
jgi:hypothetical protein